MVIKNKFRVERVYNMENIADDLYSDSKNGKNFYNLYNLTVRDDNILLAMKNIKRTIGYHTKGIDGKTVKDYENLSDEQLIHIIKKRFNRFNPMKVKRIFIAKSNGKQRSLGIITFEDRVIQQCIKQILEPICEAKFHPNSFGFRPLRSTKHAISKMMLLMQMTKYDYCVNLDIKDFFDNINHEKLINQICELGIKDKRILSILSKMLKVEIEGEGRNKMGIVQGGVISPLLSNIVLNELDWWLNSQCRIEINNKIYFVRYADDFKILCKTYIDAFKTFHTVKSWLNEQLHLDISAEKSKILNLRTQGAEFLSLNIKYNANLIESYISENNKQKIQNNLCKIISKINKNGQNAEKILIELNKQIHLWHKYYESATMVNRDFANIAKKCQKLLDDKLKNIAQKVVLENIETNYLTKISDITTYKVGNTILLPIEYVKYKKPEIFSQDMNIYTKVGRKKAYDLKQTKKKLQKFQSKHNKICSSQQENIYKKTSFDKGIVHKIKTQLNNILLQIEKYLITPLQLNLK